MDKDERPYWQRRADALVEFVGGTMSTRTAAHRHRVEPGSVDFLWRLCVRGGHDMDDVLTVYAVSYRSYLKEKEDPDPGEDRYG